MDNSNEYKYLETRPGSLYRQPFIKGTRIRAEIPYGRTVDSDGENGSIYPGESYEQIANDLRIPVEAVEEAVKYCEAHWEDVVIPDHEREGRLMEAHGMNHPDYKYNPAAYYKLISCEERSRIINDEPLS